MLPKECPVGSKKIKRSPAKSESESVVVKACLLWLIDRQIFAWRNNTGAVEFARGGFMRFGYVGSADIIGLLPTGRFLAIECKSKTGKQSVAQQKFQWRIDANRGLYILVRSVQELVIALRKENLLEPIGFRIDG